MIEIDVDYRAGDFTLCAAFHSDTRVTALFGRSGAGKSTLVNILAGLLKPERGRVRVGGETLFDSERGIDIPPSRRRIGYVFQAGHLFPHLTVRQNLVYGRFFSGGAKSADVDAITELLGLGDLLDRRPGALSGGEKQRVAIGRSLLSNPRLLLMDEPLASLDSPRKSEILRYIETLRDRFDTPIVYVTHAVSEIVRLAQTVAVLHDGRVVAVGTPGDVLDRSDLDNAIDAADIGSVIETRVAAYDETYEVSTLRFDDGELFVTKLDAPLGTAVRVYLRARDIALALERPVQTSMLNVLHGRIDRIDLKPSRPFVDVHMRMGRAHVTARITRRSCDLLGLKPNQPVYALIKAVALDRAT
jgi:molybdate transport system ATP-binding protein